MMILIEMGYITYAYYIHFEFFSVLIVLDYNHNSEMAYQSYTGLKLISPILHRFESFEEN